ncbi:MAG: acylneuraminate cytidylyltransferase family protein [Candidatus Helarchaeota archaeon]
MYKDLKIICIICARGKSKGFPRKNIQKLKGKPLIIHTLEIAQKCDLIDDIVVSTDDDEIAQVLKNFGYDIPFKRPPELATDEISIYPVILHAIKWARQNWKKDWDLIIDLQVTSPYRLVEDIEKAIQILVENDHDNVFSVTLAPNNPYFNLVEKNKKGEIYISKDLKNPIFRRQDAPEVYAINGSIYIWKLKTFMKNQVLIDKNTGIYVMPRERSIDIDEEIDLRILECIMKE